MSHTPARPSSQTSSPRPRAHSRAPSQAPPYLGPSPHGSSPYLGPPPGQPPPVYNQQSGPLLPGPYPHHPPPPSAVPPAHSQLAFQHPRGPRKRLIATCDGTWLDSDSGISSSGEAQPPSNVSRIGWAIRDTSSDGIPQVVHYSAGVGSQGGKVTKLVNGLTGMGLSDNVREAYSFLAVNYAAGDEIFLIGFSRGAWTARSVGGVVGGVGLLTRAGMPFFPAIYEDWEHRHDPNYISKHPDVPFPNKPSFSDPTYVDELERLGYTRRHIPIKAIGVWDTVGSLGIPRLGFFEGLGLQTPSIHEYSFYDTSLGEYVENAFQALALDEHRAPFSPAIWEKPKGSRTNLKQVWFPGVHSNIGGGYEDTDLANITLAWMISRLEPFIDFRPDYVLEQADLNRQFYKRSSQRPRPWSFGFIPNSLNSWYTISGSRTRTPGNYYRVDPFTGRSTNRHLRNTNEYIHPSVRSRAILRGPGVSDRGVYLPRALRDWEAITVSQPPGPGSTVVGKEPPVVWRKRDEIAGSVGGQPEIPESTLLETEIRLLGLTGPKLEGFVMGMEAKSPRRKRSKDPNVPPSRGDVDNDRQRERQRRNKEREKRDRERRRRRH